MTLTDWLVCRAPARLHGDERALRRRGRVDREGVRAADRLTPRRAESRAGERLQIADETATAEQRRMAVHRRASRGCRLCSAGSSRSRTSSRRLCTTRQTTGTRWSWSQRRLAPALQGQTYWSCGTSVICGDAGGCVAAQCGHARGAWYRARPSALRPARRRVSSSAGANPRLICTYSVSQSVLHDPYHGAWAHQVASITR